MIEVMRAGLCDLVMDLGRPGMGALGVPAGGAADPQALAAANCLVGNDVSMAGLEISLAGPLLGFPAGGVVALVGADIAAIRSSGLPVVLNESMVLAAGEALDLGRMPDGCRCWLAVRGGVAVQRVLGSRSTFMPARFGGYQGRPLRAGDRLAVDPATGPVRLLRGRPPDPHVNGPVRVVAGPQAGVFDDAGLAALFGGRYRVGASSDRRGLRLAGPAVTHARVELPSQGVLPGAIQVPPDGQPIILGWDGPVTGGYPVVASVIAADWRRLAQLRPGDVVHFSTVELEAARMLATTGWTIEELA